VAAERYWSPDYIQHSAHIEPGRDGLFSLIKNVPSTLRHEPGVIVADILRIVDEFSSSTGMFFRTRPERLDRNRTQVYPDSDEGGTP